MALKDWSRFVCRHGCTYPIGRKLYGEELNRQCGILFMFIGAAIVGATSARMLDFILFFE